MADNPNPEATEEVRLVSAKEKLAAKPGSVVLYAKGLCCPSCSIGVRKFVSRLDFVDTSLSNKGVYLDAKTQLVTVALSNDKEVDFASLAKAVDMAGYDPVRAYFFTDSEFTTHAFELPVAN